MVMRLVVALFTPCSTRPSTAWFVSRRRPARSSSRSPVPRAADPGEDLPSLRQVPVTEAGADDAAPGRPRAAAQDPVAGVEEDLRVLAIGERLEPRVGGELRGGPFPDVP